MRSRVSGDGEQSQATASEFDYDLVVLDLNCSMGGLQTKHSTIDIDRARTVEDRLQCLALGADDYP